MMSFVNGGEDVVLTSIHVIIPPFSIIPWKDGSCFRVTSHMTKIRDHKSIRALESCPKAVPWEIEIQFLN